MDKPRYNKDLDSQFGRLGFTNYSDMLDQALVFENWMSLHTRQPIWAYPSHGTQSMRYGFVVDFGKGPDFNDGVHRITMVAATLNTTVLQGGMKLTLESPEERFGISQGPLPTAPEIIEKFARTMLQFQQIKRLVEVFKMGLNSPEYLQMDNIQKPRFRI